MGKSRHNKQVEKEEMKKRQNTVLDDEVDDEGEEMDVPSKKSKQDVNNQDDAEYEVERIMEDRKVGGRTQYRVRWKGFPPSQDTWEDEENLECGQLLNEYLDGKESLDDEESTTKSKEVNKKEQKKKKHTPSKKKNSGPKRAKGDIKPDENGEFEISRIIDMHVAKNGKHEYLVLWKGFSFSDSSWEPEESVKDTAAYDRFLKRLEDAKSATVKELRVSRKPTDRFTMSTQSTKRRLSKRFENKQRAKYFETE